MKKIHIKLTTDETRTLCTIVSEIRAMLPSRAPGLEVEILLIHEFHDRHMSALHFPTPNDAGQPRNKFQFPQSQALALTKTLIGFDMSNDTQWQPYDRTLRDEIANRLSRQIGHLFSTPLSAYLTAIQQ
jgi:hypothetical protein